MGRTLGDAFVRIRPDTTTFGPELNAGVSGATRSFGSRLKGFAKVAGVALGAAGAYSAIQFAKGAVQLEADFGRTMNKIQANLQAPQSEMRKLSRLAIKMGQDTVFSASDASDAMFELAKGGMNAATIRGGALQGTLTLAAAGELSMSDAANTAVRAMGQFNLKGKDMDKVASALAGAANASSSDVSDLSIALRQGGLAANSVGFSIQETTGILAAFSNAGLEGSDAGTSLKTMLDRLIPSTDKAATKFKEVGLYNKQTGSAFVKSNGDFKSAAQIAELLQTHLGKLSDAQQKQALSVMFGSDAQRAATVLTEEGAEGLRKMIKATSDQNAAQRMAQANMKGTAGALEMMHGSIETAQLAWGRAQKPLIEFGALMVTEIANGAVPIILRFGKVMRTWMKGEGPEQALNAVKDALKGFKWDEASSGAHKLVASVKQVGPGFREAKQELPSLADGIRVAGVVVRFLAGHLDTLAKLLPALAAGFIAFKLAQMAAHVAALVSVPVRIAEVMATRAQTAALRQHGVALGMSTVAENVRTKTSIRSRVATLASAAAERIAATAKRVGAGAQWLLNAAMTANPIGLVIAAVVGLVAIFVIAYKKSETFRRIVNAAWAGIKHGAAAVWGWLKEHFVPFFTKTIPHAFGAVIDWVKSNWDVLLAILTGPIGLAVLVIRRNWDKITGAFKAAKDWVVGGFKTAWNKAKDLLSGPVQAGKDLIGGALDKVRDLFTSIKDWVVGTFKKAWAGLKLWMTDPMTAAKNVFDNLLGPGGAIRTLFDRGVAAVKSIWNGLKSAAREPVEFVVNTVYNNGLRKLVNAIPGVPDLPELHFDKGGPVPMLAGAQRGKDSIGARLMPNEHVWTEDEVKGVPGGHHGMKRMRELAKKRRLAAMGDPGWDLAPGLAGGGLPAEALQRALAFAHAQVGKPYIWGGTGPGGYDCSGFMSGITDVLRGGDGAGTRYGTTSSFPWPGFLPGFGEFTIGNSHRYGHMGGTLAGVDVESTNSSVRMGGVARGAGDPMFDQHYHMGRGGAQYAQSSGGWGFGIIKDAIETAKDVLGKVSGWFQDLTNMKGWGGLMRQMVTSLGNKLIGWLNDKIPNFGPIPDDPIPTFDRGGKARGRGLLLKNTMDPERMLNPEETRSYDQIGALIRELRSGRRRPVRLVVDGREFRAYLEEVADEAVELAADFDDHYARGGR